MGNGLCRGKEWQIEGLWPKDEGVETFDRCNLECKKDQACTAFDVSPSEQKGLYRCHHFGHDKVTATNSVSLRGKCYRMKGRKAIRNAKPKQTFEKDAKNYKLLGQGISTYKYFSVKSISRFFFKFVKFIFSPLYITAGQKI